jgi:hypothetical protein
MAVPLGAEKMHLGVIKYTGALLYQTEVKNSAAVGVSQPAPTLGSASVFRVSYSKSCIPFPIQGCHSLLPLYSVRRS